MTSKQHKWEGQESTTRQRSSLVRLGVELENNMSKVRAHDLIMAARAGKLAEVGGEYI